MAAVHITGNYYFQADGDNFVLLRQFDRKPDIVEAAEEAVTGEKKKRKDYKSLGFYTTIEGLIQALLYRSDLDTVREGEGTLELKDALTAMRQSRLTILDAVKGELESRKDDES